MKFSNFHTHSTYCDGKNTCEEMVIAAIEKGFSAIGFSGHSYIDFDSSYCMSEDNISAYKNEVCRLKNKYKDEIAIYCGIEEDYYSQPRSDFEYKIGSVHHVLKSGIYIDVDNTSEKLLLGVNRYYGGDFYSFAKDYFLNVADVYNKTKCDIIGHFDLITKFNEKNVFFDENDCRYKSVWTDALDELLKRDVVFEVNTGAVARGYRTYVYPSEEILKYIKNKGGRVIITTDCHDKDKIDFYIKEAYQIIKNIGLEYVDFEDILKKKYGE